MSVISYQLSLIIVPTLCAHRADISFLRSPRFILGASSKINFGLLSLESKIYLGRLVQNQFWTPESGVQDLSWAPRPK
ncbi:hypothetical protein PN36_29745 [Candidatus Thiomargarita nelsonii]|uniref:Uncharacterized protein n=1 Tax=Candidatus Thiomargarita nelsonii TaxID=1003181 RepID=A0A4E0QXC0_9GAMM|nr:hypothetical protein PN36_29745 [Candidatus Thiomargarita nelsonii]